MIIGNGDIASAIPDREDLLFFASGVSNSKELREEEYQREIDLLKEQDRSRHIVYFSSLCIFYLETRYAQHKRYMEELIKTNFEHWTIVRLGNIDWGKNPNTIINYFRGRKAEGEPITIQEGQRYVCGKEEFQHWLGMIPAWNCEMNVTGRMMEIKDIVKEYVDSYQLERRSI